MTLTFKPLIMTLVKVTLLYATFTSAQPFFLGSMNEKQVNQNSFVNITDKRDFIIGGLFPVFTLKGGASCGTTINEIQHLEAMLWSIDQVNQKVLKDIGVTIGVKAYDTCYSDTIALKRALNFIPQRYIMETQSWQCDDGREPTYRVTGKMIGVVGASTSAVSKQVASFLRLFRLPQVSYLATSPELSDVARYNYFMRTVSSDEYQAKAIVGLLRSLNWTYVTAIYEDTSYGQYGVDSIEEAADPYVCIGHKVQVKRYFANEKEKTDELKTALLQLGAYNNTNGFVVVILFLSRDIVESIFELVQSGIVKNHYRWVGSDGWVGMQLSSNVRPVALRAYGIQPAVRDVGAFDDYFLGLSPQKNTRNPWFDLFWQQLFNCFLPGNDVTTFPFIERDGDCASDLRIEFGKGNLVKDRNTYTTMDAVYAFGHAIKNLHKTKCPNSLGVCIGLRNITGEDVLQALKDVSFEDPLGLEFHFEGNSAPPRYSVMHYVEVDGVHQWTEVGNYTGDIHYYRTSFEDTSVCSAPCKKGQARSLKGKCCWSCITCTFYQYLDKQSETCVDCPDGMLPENQNRTTCVDIEVTTMDFGNTWAIISMILSTVGLIVSILVGVIFYYHRKTPIIMASGKELSFVLLVGIFMSYMSTYVFVAHPTPATCGTTRLMMGLCYTICYAAIVVKTNRIYRVFNIQTSKPKKVRFISAKSQLLITSAILMVEVVALAMWLVFDPPVVLYEYPTKMDKILVCKDSQGYSYIAALIYPFILMIFCVVYALKTRKTPDGFNETRYITFGCYSFCIMWIAFISIYFSVRGNNTIRIMALSFASTVNATVTLITLFITKVYVVIFRPQKNTRENVMSRRRTHTYETVDLNMQNLSRMVSAVSTWQSVYPSIHSDIRSGSHGPVQVFPRVGNKLSVSALALSNANGGGTAGDSQTSIDSTISAPAKQRGFTEEELNALKIHSKSTGDMRTEEELLDERLKKSGINLKDTDSDNSDDGGGIDASHRNRRSLRSFKARRKSRRRANTVKARPGDLRRGSIPNITVTMPSSERLNNVNNVHTVRL